MLDVLEFLGILLYFIFVIEFMEWHHIIYNYNEIIPSNYSLRLVNIRLRLELIFLANNGLAYTLNCYLSLFINLKKHPTNYSVRSFKTVLAEYCLNISTSNPQILRPYGNCVNNTKSTMVYLCYSQ